MDYNFLVKNDCFSGSRSGKASTQGTELPHGMLQFKLRRAQRLSESGIKFVLASNIKHACKSWCVKIITLNTEVRM